MESMDREFIIDGRTLDFGKEGRFGPGSEGRLRTLLKKKGDEGDMLFNRLVGKGQIKFVNTKPAPKLPKDIDTKSPEPGEDDTTAGDEAGETENLYEATGSYELDHYGGGNYNIIDPDGNVIENIRGKKKAETKIEELNLSLDN